MPANYSVIGSANELGTSFVLEFTEMPKASFLTVEARKAGARRYLPLRWYCSRYRCRTSGKVASLGSQ